jgi:hypothetical protein
MNIEGIDPKSVKLSGHEALALERMLEVYRVCRLQNKKERAHGARLAIMAMWDTLQGDFHDTDPETGHGELDGHKPGHY